MVTVLAFYIANFYIFYILFIKINVAFHVKQLVKKYSHLKKQFNLCY